jgi:hypothetical protein
MWEQFGISPIAFAEFWNLNAAILPEPRTKNAASPLRKLFNMFYVNPQRAKLPLFLIYHALNHPLMIFHGLGIHTAKKVVYTYKKDSGKRPSEKLIEACGLVFKSLQEVYPGLFGKPDRMDEIFHRQAILRVVATLFVSSSNAKKKKAIARDTDGHIDEVCILDNIAR